MDTENVKIWVYQPNVCRCCLSASGTFDLQAPYVKEDGQKEVYYETLKNCFGIDMLFLSDRSPSKSICTACAEHLFQANTFKLQVLQAEENFAQYFDMKDKFNVKIESAIENDHNTDNYVITRSESTKVSKRNSHRKKKKIKKKKIQNNLDWDSDTPLNEFTRAKETENELLIEDRDEFTRMKEIEDKLLIKERKGFTRAKEVEDKLLIKEGKGFARTKEVEDKLLIEEKKELTRVKEIEDKFNGELLEEREGELEFRTDFTSKGPNQIKTKLVSERKKIRLTCETVLNNTTACPFRHHKSWFQCFYCTQEFMEIDQLKIHLQNTHKNIKEELKTMKRYPRSLQIDITKLYCNICKENLINIDNLCTHFQQIHDRVVYKECIADYKVNASPYVCHLCEKQFHVFRTLTTHLNDHYANCICDVCGKSFLNTKRLKVHKRTHENGHYPCLECGKVLKTKISKANHIETVHSKRVIKCQICFKPMKHYNDRIKHMSEEHNITHKFKCPFCGREYNIKHYLATHIRQTHGHKNKKCLDCGMAFITNHGLKKHMQRHSGVKEFTCDICSKSYARSYSLKEHMRAHNDRGF